MITNANALQSALAHLLTEPVGHRISMDAKIRNSMPDFNEWAVKNTLGWKSEDGKLTLWRKP